MLNIILFIVTAAPILDDANGAQKKARANPIEGIWILESYTNEGVTKSGSTPGTTFQWQRIEIDGNSLVEWYSQSARPDATKIVMRFRLHPMRDTRQFEFGRVLPNGRPAVWTKKGIYKIEGDTLSICFRVELADGPKVEIPKEFAAAVGSRTGLAVYRRSSNEE